MNKVCFIKGFIEDVETILNYILAAEPIKSYQTKLIDDPADESETPQKIEVPNDEEGSTTNADAEELCKKLVAMGIYKEEFTREERKDGETLVGYTYTYSFVDKYDGFSGGTVAIEAIGTDTVIAFIGK